MAWRPWPGPGDLRALSVVLVTDGSPDKLFKRPAKPERPAPGLGAAFPGLVAASMLATVQPVGAC